ncbi:MAG: type II toxin-antitoxin system PemK/MazF family toxin [Chloroflexota bacterium]
MRRGDVWLVDLEPARGSEADKRRPAVIVSNDGSNMAVERLQRGTVTVVPLTSSIGRVLGFQVLVPAGPTGLPFDSKAQAEQVRTVDLERLGVKLGSVPAAIMTDLDDALRLHLDL